LAPYAAVQSWGYEKAHSFADISIFYLDNHTRS